MTPTAPKASGRPRLARFVSFVFLLLACLVLPQQAAAAPDLTVDSVRVSSASVVAGAVFTINATVNNEGNAASAATTLTYYRSADATITTGDTSMATDSVSALAASGSSPESALVFIATADTYYVGACVPTVSGETNTTNNCSTGVQVVVTAPDVNTVTIGNRTVAENISGGSIGFTVSLTRAVDSDVTLAVVYAPDTAILDDDLGTPLPYTVGTASLADDLGTPLLTTVTIDRGNTSATLAVPIANETLVEGDETFTVTLIEDPASPLPEGVEIGNGMAIGKITNDDEAEIRTNVADVNETAARLTFRPGVTAPLAQDLVLAWEVTGGTASAADFSQYVSSGTVTIPARQNSAPIHFTPLDDDLVEGNETLTLTFSPAPGTSLPDGVTFHSTTATATITDNDANYMVSIDNASVAENGARSVATFTAKLTEAVGSDVVLAVAVAAGTATLANDLGAPLPDTVTIDEGKTEATFTVHIINDNLVEENETFTVTLSADPDTPLPDGVAIRDGTATGTIEDDDRATVSITPAALTAAENGTFTYTVSLSAPADEAVTVRWTATNGTATVADDLQATTNTVTFNANDNTAQTFTIAVNDDDLDEDNETFTVTLEVDTAGGNPLPTGVSIGTSNSATGTITDNDYGPPPPTVNVVTIDDASVAENGGNAAFTVRLTRAVTSDVVLAVAYADGTATLADDLGTRPDTVTIEDGATRATLLVPVTNDNIVEGNENFTVTISEGATPLPEGVTIGTNNTATGTITDDDTPAVNATVSIAAASVAENGGNAEFTVSLSRPVGSDVVLAVAYADGTATLADDLEEDLPDTVTIEDGASIATFSATLLVPIINDNLVEGSEDFTVTISEGTTPLPEGVTIGTDDTATGTITDDDAAEVTLSPAELTAAEDASFAYTVSLSATVAEAVTVRWTATAESGDTATVADDLQKQTGTVTFNANDNTDQTFTIAVTDDEEFEQDETFTVTLSAPGPMPDGVTIGTNNSSTATIIDNDGAGMAQEAEVSIADADPVKEDAGPVRFTVSLSRTVPSDVVLDITYAADTAGLEDLGSSRPGTVTIPANATTASFAVPITDDTAIEEAETFTVTLSDDTTTLPPGVSIADGRAIGTIAFTPEPSILIEPRRTGAGTALRRHVGRFDRMTSTVVRNRLDARQTRHLSGSQDLGNGALAMGGGLGDTNWGVWLDGAWAGLGGRSSGRQADIYGGVDYRGSDGDWLIGALIGHELADLDIGPATYEAGYTHFGLYGGGRLSARLLVDGALTYGVATPEVAQGSVSASYDAHRVTARGALTGDFGLDYGLEDGVVKLQPQLGLLYAREQLGAFTDSIGGVADREHLELGRLSAGPRATWAFDGGQLIDGGQLAGGARGQWDFHRLGDGIDERVSAAVDVGLTLDLAPGVSLGLQGDVDGLGITDEFRSFGGKINLGIRF